jgi:DNA-binding LacI/PurR family transcriptional regulator
MSTEEPAPTIFDVADLASVSVSTVSRVINGRADVSAATRSRVEAAIGRLSFAPQVTAQRLAGRRSHTVAMLFPSAYAQHSNHDLDFVLGAAEATSGRDYLFNVASDPLDEPRMRALFRSRLVEGAILMQITAQDWRVELAAREQLPCVLIGRTDTEHPLSWVDFDFEGAAAAMVDHLVMTGHRSIGFVGRSHAMLDAGLGPATRLRRGHEQAVLRHGLELHHVASDLDPLAAGQAALHLVDSVDDLSAVVATHGPSALGMLRALRSRGLRVPEDVSVLTVATSRVAELSMPSLSGTDFPSAQLGFQAASVLVRQLDDRARGVAPRTEHILMPARLSVRETSAPLARS